MPDRTPRRHVRLSGAAAAAALAAGMLALPAATAEEQNPNPTAPEQFEGDVADLPAGMAQAVERDLRISAAQYLANAHAARDYVATLADLRDDGVSVSAAVFDSSDQTLAVHLIDDADAATVEAIDGVRLLEDEPDSPSMPDEFASSGDISDDRPNDGAEHPSAIMSAEAVEPLVGMEVCGATGQAGFRCGEILAVDTEVPVDGTPVRGFVTDICAAADELGGAVRAGIFPVGTLTAGAQPESGECAGRDAETAMSLVVLGDESDGQDDVPGEDENPTDDPASGEVPPDKPDVPAPSVDRPANGDVVDPQVQFEGSVPDAGTDDRVVISIDDQEAGETPVDEDGSFSATLPEPLPADTEHTYTVRTHRDDDSQSEAVSGDFTVAPDDDVPPIIPISVMIPVDGQEFLDPQPYFAGSGQGVSDIDVAIDGETFGETGSRVDSGYWRMIPEPALPVGVRFDAVFTETWDHGSGEVHTDSETITDLGVRAPRVAVTSPEHGSAVQSDAVFEGTSFPGADVEVRLEDGADDGEELPGELDTDEDGSWTFVPDDELPEGEYTVIAEATLDGGDAELSDSTSGNWFTVSE